jgi:hypothetical protein
MTDINGNDVSHSKEGCKAGANLCKKFGVLKFFLLRGEYQHDNRICIAPDALTWPEPSRRNTRPKVDLDTVSPNCWKLFFKVSIELFEMFGTEKGVLIERNFTKEREVNWPCISSIAKHASGPAIGIQAYSYVREFGWSSFSHSILDMDDLVKYLESL